MICAGNWKLNKSPSETFEFLNKLKEATPDLDQSQFIVFPPAISLSKANDSLKGSELNLGCQNISTQESGAFTGETSINHALDVSCQFVLIGHSERRTLYSETNKDVAQKIKLALSKGMEPMVCIGETLQQRKSGDTFKILTEQMKTIFEVINNDSSIFIAYEPVWAIGTGVVASSEQVDEVHNFLRQLLADQMGKEFSKKTPLLYGGSVKPANSKELSLIENVDGFLIGGASLKVDSFVEIYTNSLID